MRIISITETFIELIIYTMCLFISLCVCLLYNSSYIYISIHIIRISMMFKSVNMINAVENMFPKVVYRKI